MRHLFLALISAIFLTLASCGQNKFYEFAGYAWGTTYHIVYDAPVDLGDSILAEFERVDNSLSVFNPISTISAINASRTTRVDPYFAQVLEISKRVNTISHGAFDPTVEPLVSLWGFGKIDREPDATPSDSAIAAALDLVGISQCRITDDGFIRKPHPLTSFDFSGVAKGFGIKQIALMLRRNGARNFKVEVGGELVLQGTNPSGRPWLISIDAPVIDPTGHNELLQRHFGPEATSIASSGNYRNYRTDSLGNRYGHTISPHTGRPIQSDVLAATVILSGDSCGKADALATSAMVLNSDSATAMLRRAGVSAILVIGIDSTCRRTIEITPDSVFTLEF